MAEVIFLVIVAICIIALFAIEGNRAKQKQPKQYILGLEHFLCKRWLQLMCKDKKDIEWESLLGDIHGYGLKDAEHHSEQK